MALYFMKMRILILLLVVSTLCFLGCQPEEGKGAMPEFEPEAYEILSGGGKRITKAVNVENHYKKGQVIDHLNKVPIFYNGNGLGGDGRHTSDDGYNYGLKWQCVEFVKRYYYDYLHHPMPNTYGHAKHFYHPDVVDGGMNLQRNLRQFSNGGVYKPQVNDILVFEGREYGHVAIISRVLNDEIEITQQNVGRSSRHQIKMLHKKGRYYLMNRSILGWLGKRE